jgi:hypothetical protein
MCRMGRLLFIFCFLSTVLCGSATEELPFQVGEKLTYHFYWGPFMVGRGTFEVTQGDQKHLYVLTVKGESNDFISPMYPVDDLIQSVFDTRKLRSVSCVHNRKEGKRHVWEESFFFYDHKIASTTSYLSGDQQWYEIPTSGVQDEISNVYFLRCQEWNHPKAEVSVTIANDKGNYDVKFQKKKTETLESPDFAPIPTFLVEPNTQFMRGFLKKGKMQVWVSDDHFKIPVRVTSKLSFGTLCASLVQVEGVPNWPYNRPER